MFIYYIYFNCRILEALRVEWQNSTPRLASTPERTKMEIYFLFFLASRCIPHTAASRLSSTLERRNGNINLSKYFISSSEDRTHNQSVLQSQLVPLRHDWPRYY